MLAIAFLFVIAKNIGRTRTGRAFRAIRDRDIAAEVMGVRGVQVQDHRVRDVSSFFAGIAGDLLRLAQRQGPGDEWSLFLSVEFIAILLIGGVGTVAGTVLGAFFVVLGPTIVEQSRNGSATSRAARGSPGRSPTPSSRAGSGDRGAIATGSQSPGWPLNVFDWNVVIYGLLIIVFLIFEPLGLYGIWVKVRNYWKRWPFSH